MFRAWENSFVTYLKAKMHLLYPVSVISHVMRSLQRSQFKANHAEWVNTVKPNLGPGIRERVQEAIESGDEGMGDLHAVRTEFKSALAALVKDRGILGIPTVPGPPPELCMEAAALENFRARAFALLSIAGLSGFFARLVFHWACTRVFLCQFRSSHDMVRTISSSVWLRSCTRHSETKPTKPGAHHHPLPDRSCGMKYCNTFSLIHFGQKDDCRMVLASAAGAISH